jgi:hypothetical protein
MCRSVEDIPKCLWIMNALEDISQILLKRRRFSVAKPHEKYMGINEAKKSPVAEISTKPVFMHEIFKGSLG